MYKDLRLCDFYRGIMEEGVIFPHLIIFKSGKKTQVPHPPSCVKSRLPYLPSVFSHTAKPYIRNMRYRREGDIILISRNKRYVLKKVKEGWNNGGCCIDCALFEVCLVWGKEKSICERMAESGVITEYSYEEDHYFINV
jgi:hypothetical protein